MKGILSRAGIVLLSAMLGISAQAATITFDFIAEVRDLDGAAANIQALADEGVTTGTRTQGSLTVTTEVPNVGGSPNVGLYVGAVTGLTLTLGGHVATFSGSFNDLYVLNDGPEDIFLGTAEIDFGGPVIQDGLFALQLRDSSGGSWNSTDIPLGPFDLTSFDSYVPFDGFGTTVFFSQVVNGSLVEIFSEIKFMEAKVIPVPAAVWLFGFALASLAGLRRR